MPDPVNPNELDLGHVKEGVVEIDPMTGRMTIRSENRRGGFTYFDVQEALTKYEGREVRVVIVPQDTINQIATLVENGDLPLSAAPVAGGNSNNRS
jgi:hypothetical protein